MSSDQTASLRAFLDLDAKRRRRLVLLAVARTAAAAVGVVLVYFALPLDDASRDTTTTVLLIVAALALFVGVIISRLRKVEQSEVPGVSAIEAAAFILMMFLAIFSAIYLLISSSNPAAFSQPLNHATALYFTTTVTTTVGFGDITAVQDSTRLLVTLQMVTNLAVLGLLGRGLFTAAQAGIQRRAAEAEALETAQDGDEGTAPQSGS